jgi:hypothetical protein
MTRWPKENEMQPRIKRAIVSTSVVLVVLLSIGRGALAQTTQPSYPSMAPVDQYLIADRNAEIALARSAAPEAVSGDAKVMVLGRHGYETAIEGKNGFVCVVERSWMSPFDDPGFWNPKNRSPTCFNPAAARSILPITLKRTELVLTGLSKPQLIDSIRAAVEKGGLPPLEPGAMCYMMSKLQFLGDAVGHFAPHLMFYVPRTDPAAWGANQPGSPVLMDPRSQGGPVPITVFMVPVRKWSDGTPFVM